MVSEDHHIFRTPGTLYHIKVNSDLSVMFSGGCVFVDSANGYISMKH